MGATYTASSTHTHTHTQRYHGDLKKNYYFPVRMSRTSPPPPAPESYFEPYKIAALSNFRQS
jgi:hypothetical protein